MNFIKNIAKCIMKFTAELLFIITSSNSLGRYLLDQIINKARANTKKVEHNGFDFIFSVPSSLSFYRTTTFASKEPETLAWLDAIPKNSILWDIGANVGLYSCYAAKTKNCTVFAFEPSVLNLELLARNIFLNDLTSKVTIVPLPLSDKMSLNTLNMTTMELGGALSTFGQDYGHDGNLLNVVFSFSTIGLSMVDVVEKLNVPIPNYIKIDVDGIEALILQGGHDVLSKVQGVLIEINENFESQYVDANTYLSKAGLVLIGKSNADKDSLSSKCYNQIWARSHN
jgi:FkbM family methyltransferase